MTDPDGLAPDGLTPDGPTDDGGAGVADEAPLPTLMRAARGTYAQAIRAELAAAGIDDLPRNGVPVLFGTLADRARPRLAAQLGVSKQAVSQLVEILVQRGYLVRRDDPEDGRRVGLELTGPGRRVIDAVERAVDSVDQELAAALSPAELQGFRRALQALAGIKADRVLRGVGRARPRRGRARFDPVFPVRDLAAARAHYERLGFRTHAFDDGYGFADGHGVSVHLSVHPDLRPEDNETAAYLHVPDVDAVQATWSAAGVGVTTPVVDTPWGMREGSHTDPDGNVIRFGTPTADG